MKKLLSMILACAMVMSLFCVVPAGATSASAAEHSFPYIIENFEDGDVSFFGDTENLDEGVNDSVVEATEGFAGSENAAKITYTGVSHTIGNYLYNSNGQLITTTANNGDTFTATFMLKAEQNLNATKLLIVLWSGTYWRNYTQVTFDGSNKGWQKVTMSYTFPDQYDIDKIEFRFGDTGATNRVVDGSGSPTDADRVYYVDDFEMQISKPVVEEKQYPYSEVVSLAATDGTSWNNIEVRSQGDGDTQTVATETVDGVTNTFLRHTHSAGGKMQYKIHLKENLKAGHTYVLTFKTRILGLPLQDGTLDPAGPASARYDYLNMRSYYHYSGHTWSGSSSNGHYEAWTSNSAATRYLTAGDGGPGPYTDERWRGGSAAAYASWHDTKITFSSAKQNIEEDLSTDSFICLDFGLYYMDGRVLGTYDFDDFKVVDLGPVTNGGFEDTISTRGVHDGLNDTKQFQGSVAGWHVTSGSTAAVLTGSGNSAARIPSEQADNTKSALEYSQQSATGEIYQYVPVHAGESYTIKGYVRGNSSTVGRARLVADFTGTTLDKEVYDVLALGTNGVIYGDWVEFGASEYNTSAPLSLTMDLTNIGLISGKTATAGIMPKSPKVYIDFDESWGSNVNAPGTAAHSVYMDAFTFKRNGTEGAPTISAVNVTGDIVPGNELNVSYSFAATGAATNASVTKLMARDGDNAACLAVFKSTEDVIVPDSALGRDVYIQIIPASSNMALAGVDYEISPDYEINFELGEFVDSPIGGKKVTATATVMGLTPDNVGRNIDAVIVVALYDINGAFVDFVEKDIALTAGMAQTTFTCSYDEIGLNIKYAKAFIWECDVPVDDNPSDDIIPKASITNSTMRSLASFDEVTRP